MRKLVSMRTVNAVTPVKGADRLDVATVGGWQVAVPRGVWQPGDRGVFFEVDSLIPAADQRFAFLGEQTVTQGGAEYHRIRTIRLRGQLSQGLLLPLDDFPDWESGLGVVKYDPPVPTDNAPVGPFPLWATAKTDAERVQNLTDQWGALRQRAWRATEKIDGTSLTVVVAPPVTIVASRNWAVARDSLHHRVANSCGVIAAAHALTRRFDALTAVIQCEIYGPGVQGNPLDAPHLSVAAFRCFVDGVSWLDAVADFGVPTAPTLNIPFPDTVEEAIAAADGLQSVVVPGKQSEGIVWHSDIMAVKSINNRLLLQTDAT